MSSSPAQTSAVPNRCPTRTMRPTQFQFTPQRDPSRLTKPSRATFRSSHK